MNCETCEIKRELERARETLATTRPMTLGEIEEDLQAYRERRAFLLGRKRRLQDELGKVWANIDDLDKHVGILDRVHEYAKGEGTE